MRIAIVLPFNYIFCALNPTSVETVVRRLNTPLNEDHEIVIICREGAIKACELKTFTIKPCTKESYLKQACKFISQFQPDYIEVHQTTSLASFIARQFDIPTILYKHNYLKAKNALQRFKNRILLSPIRGIVFVSNDAKQDFINNYPTFANRAYAIPNPVYFGNLPVQLAQKENVIFFSGRAIPEKGLGELCDGLQLVLKEFSDWRAVLILSKFAQNAEWASEQLKKLEPYKSQVKILKDQPLEIVMSEEIKSKIAIVPSKFKEPFGLVALEAHACSNALISSGTGGLKEASGDNALFIETVSGDAIYSAVKKLIETPELLANLAQNGRNYVEQMHSLNKRMNELVAVRNNALTNPKVKTV